MRKLPLRNGGVISDFLSDVRSTVEATEAAELTPISAALAAALDDLDAATQHLAAIEEPNDALAGATPYCRLFGLVACGHYLGQQAVVAAATPADEWMQDKVTVATFYATQLLPQTGGLLPAVTSSAKQLFDVDLAAAGA
ncbi:MAG: acyl-CoA dehydrogenase C-terminal domain-containing protein [Acidimicrobiia bacterium]|nr:acyl-CoA dehydrogenase C-terminal domain-containing protein [Acidimicrobiia bacterium]